MTEQKRYRYRDLKPEDAYCEAWKYLHTGELVQANGLGLGMLTFALALVVGIWVKPPVVVLYVMVGIAFGLFLIGAGLGTLWIAGFNCPRCEKSRMEMMSANESRCPNCGLPKWAPDDPDKEPADD